MEEFKDSPTSLIADVDCTAEGKELCTTHGVQGYPTIKYGDPSDLQDYNGGRSFDDLKKFAEENLGPQCGPNNLDLCDAAVKTKLEKFMTMSAGKLEGKARNAKKVVAEDVPLMKKVLASKQKEEDMGFRPGDKVQISGLDACARHNGKLCKVDAVDQATKAVRVMFLDSNNMLELAPEYLQLVEAVEEQEQPVSLPDGATQQIVDGSPEVGTMVQILAPPHHRGKVAVVETPNTGSGTLRIRLQDPNDSVTTLVVSPAHVANLDGSPVAGTVEAVAASQAQADALRDAATLPPSANAAAALPSALAPGARVRVNASLAHHSGKSGIVEIANDGTGNAVIQLEDSRAGVMRIKMNPAHLDLM